MSDNVEKLKTLGNIMLRDFLDHDHVQEVCHEVTLNTLGWSAARFKKTMNHENSPRYDLYYATLSNVHSKVMSYMIDGLFHPNTPVKD